MPAYKQLKIMLILMGNTKSVSTPGVHLKVVSSTVGGGEMNR